MPLAEPRWLLFASDAALLALSGGAFLATAVIALVLDRRRHNRNRVGAPDRVGWVPWTAVFLICAVMGLGLLAVSLPALMRG